MPSFEDLHLKPPISAALERLGWKPDDPGVREVVPTAARGHNLIAVTPPVPVYAAPAVAGLLSRLTGGNPALLLCPPAQLDEWGALVHRLARDVGLRVQVAHGTARAMRRLRANSLDVIVASPETALTLVSRSVLRMDAVATLLLGWPESWIHEDTLTPLMQDLPKDAQRLIYTGERERVGTLVERYARKALTIELSSEESGPVGPVRTVSVPWSRRIQALAELVELLDPASLVVWTADRSYHEVIAQAVAAAEPHVSLVTGDASPVAMVIAFDIPTGERLRQLLTAGEVALLVPPSADGYVRRIAAPRRPLQLPGPLDEVRTIEAAQRATIVAAIESGNWHRSLLTLAPLFERHDPTAVAAALLDLWTGSARTGQVPAEVPPSPKVYVSVGKKDGVTANDLVGVLTRELRVERDQIGRIELRDTFSLIEIVAENAAKVASALNGVTVRRKRVTARVDRGPSRQAPREGRPNARPARRR